MSLSPEKILLRWMNFQLKKAGYKKIVTNFSSDVKVDEKNSKLLLLSKNFKYYAFTIKL